MKTGTDFTHFGSIPFIRQIYRKQFTQLQNKITSIFKQKSLQKTLKPSNPNLFHLTLSMLTLSHQSTRIKVQQMMKAHHSQLAQTMRNIKFLTDKIKYFTLKKKYTQKKNTIKNISVIYLDLLKDKNYQCLLKLTDTYIRIMLKQQIIVQQDFYEMYIQYNLDRSMYMSNAPHITLFRCENLLQDNNFIQCYKKIQNLFIGIELQCDYIDISTRWSYDHTKFYTPFYRINLNQEEKKSSQMENKQIKEKQQYILNNPNGKCQKETIQ